MSSLRFVIVCLLSAMAAFVGSCVSVRLVSPVSVTAQSQSEIIPIVRTPLLQLVDKKGKVRGTLSVDDNFGPQLFLQGNSNEWLLIGGEPGSKHQAIDFFGDGKARLQLGLTGEKSSPSIRLNDKFPFRLMMFLDDDGSPSIGMTGIEGHADIVLGVRSDGPVLVMRDASILSPNDGGATLRLGSKTAKDNLVLNVEANGDSWVKADRFRSGK